MTKDQAIIKILKVLKSPMMVMSVYNRDEALTIAEEHGITVKDLIEELDTGEIDLDVIGFGADELAELMEQTKPGDEKELDGSGEKCEACGRPL